MRFYVSLFPDSAIEAVSRYGKAGFEVHGRPEGSMMTVAFRLAGQSFNALNGGPQFRFSEAISFQVSCETQAGVDHFWNQLAAGGEEGPCGWLKDRFGLSWQIVPSVLPRTLGGPEAAKRVRVTKAFMGMKKFDIAALERAYSRAMITVYVFGNTPPPSGASRATCAPSGRSRSPGCPTTCIRSTSRAASSGVRSTSA